MMLSQHSSPLGVVVWEVFLRFNALQEVFFAITYYRKYFKFFFCENVIWGYFSVSFSGLTR